MEKILGEDSVAIGFRMDAALAFGKATDASLFTAPNLLPRLLSVNEIGYSRLLASEAKIMGKNFCAFRYFFYFVFSFSHFLFSPFLIFHFLISSIFTLRSSAE
jgi:hypothetical protein